jgi:Icc-related predicted phosphoesterase
MLVLGDAHASDPDRRRALFAAYRAADADHALQVGDLEHYRLPIPTYFVAGNNEDQDVVEALRHGRVRSSAVRNAHLLHSTVAAVGGRRIAGLSGNYAPTQYRKDRADLAGERRRHFIREDVTRALDLADADVEVLLTHEAPHGLPVREDYEVGCDPIDRLLAALDPELCLVGHHHQHAESRVGSTRVVSLAPAWTSYYALDPETLALTRHSAPPV